MPHCRETLQQSTFGLTRDNKIATPLKIKRAVLPSEKPTENTTFNLPNHTTNIEDKDQTMQNSFH